MSPKATASDLLAKVLLEELEVLQGDAGPKSDTVHRVVGDVARHAGHLGEQLVDVPEQRSAAGHDHALVDDVARKLGRGLLQNEADGADDLLKRGLHCLHDFGAVHRDGARQAGDQVTAADVHSELAFQRQSGADLDLHFFGGPVTDHEVVLLADVAGDRFVDLVSADAKAGRDHDRAQGDDRDLTRAAADVDDHRAGRAADRHVCTDGSRHRLFDEVCLRGARLESRVTDGALLDAGHACRDADHDLRLAPAEAATLLHSMDKVVQESFGDHVVGNDAVSHRPDGLDVAGRTADHLAGLFADRHDVVLVVDGDYGGFLHNDAVALDVNDDVGRAQVDTDLHACGCVPSETRSILAPSSRNFASIFS